MYTYIIIICICSNSLYMYSILILNQKLVLKRPIPSSPLTCIYMLPAWTKQFALLQLPRVRHEIPAVRVLRWHMAAIRSQIKRLRNKHREAIYIYKTTLLFCLRTSTISELTTFIPSGRSHCPWTAARDLVV